MEMVLQQPLYKRLAAGDWLYALLIIVAAGYSFSLYGSAMDYYEQLILVGSSIGLVALGWFWPSWRWFFPLAGIGLIVVSYGVVRLIQWFARNDREYLEHAITAALSQGGA